ncbi:hypothetical protein Mapa_012346 [Marchantia paleacea]|nr:hypothetical protein Mapa_012346 [Marchantia paleacea]
MDSNNWRTGLPHDSRQKIVKRIMDTLQRHMPPTGQESMGELLKNLSYFGNTYITNYIGHLIHLCSKM